MEILISVTELMNVLRSSLLATLVRFFDYPVRFLFD